jgi:hypothetical protein
MTGNYSDVLEAAIAHLVAVHGRARDSQLEHTVVPTVSLSPRAGWEIRDVEREFMSGAMFDCSRVPGPTCSIQIFGERDDVAAAAFAHLVSVHAYRGDFHLEQNVRTAVDSYRELAAYAESAIYPEWA